MAPPYHLGLAVMRCQPFHIGHARLARRLLNECAFGIICFGSIQEEGTKRNPFSLKQRITMFENWRNNDPYLRNVQPFFMGMPDIPDDSVWMAALLAKIRDELGNGKPEAYYCGSEFDGRLFQAEGMTIELVDRAWTAVPYWSASMIREMCLYGDERWKLYVHPENQELVQKQLCGR